MVAGSLFIISWATALGEVYHAGAQNAFAFSVSIAYPASDVMMITVAVIVASRVKLSSGLFLLLGGLASMAVADSAFAYLVAVGTYGTGAFTDVAWVAAFLAIGLSALYPAADESHGDDAGRGVGGRRAAVRASCPPAPVATLVGLIRNIDTPVTFGVESVVVVAVAAAAAAHGARQPAARPGRDRPEGRADPPGLPRSAHRAREPGAVLRPRGARDRAAPSRPACRSR